MSGARLGAAGTLRQHGTHGKTIRVDARQIPAQAAPRDADDPFEPDSSSADAADGDATCTAAELARRQRAVAGTRKELLEAVDKVTRKAP